MRALASKVSIKILTIVIVAVLGCSVGFVIFQNSLNSNSRPATQTAPPNHFLVGAGTISLSNHESINQNLGMHMNLATAWISSRDDLYGWWGSYYSPQSFWNKSIIPHLITYQYFTTSWGVDYSPASLNQYRQQWLDDLRYMATKLKAPDDGNHTVLISLETEFNCYKNIDYVYWNQLMIDSRNAIKEIAPNVLVSYCIGCWEWRFNDDLTMNGSLTSSMQSMDFMSFQCIWGAYGEEATKWLNGDKLKTDYGAYNWEAHYGVKSGIWDYMVDEVAANLAALSKINPHVLLAHLAINDYLWGEQAQVDAVNELAQKIPELQANGLFGISWMDCKDISEDSSTGFMHSDGTIKPCAQAWAALVNQYAPNT